jgi:hypothetical protein
MLWLVLPIKTAVLSPKQCVLLSSLAACVLLPLGSCANSPWSKTLERSLAADPRLEGNSSLLGMASSDASNNPGTATAELPANFPGEIPRYPNAELIGVTQPDQTTTDPTANTNQAVATQWATPDTTAQVQQFYQEKFQTGGWKLTNQPPATGSTSNQMAIAASRDNLQVTVAIAAPTVNSAGASPSASPSALPSASPSPAATSPTATTITANKTEFTVSYQFGGNPASTSASSQTPQSGSSGSGPQPGDPNFMGPVLPQNQTAQSGSSPSEQTIAATPGTFTDIDQAPADLQPYIIDLAKLGALQFNQSTGSDKTSNQRQLAPNQIISRRDYARWLVAANNLIYANQPARKIRLGVASEQPAFQDVPKSDPDFGIIQGLANAGILPSSLSGDSTTVTFRPDAQLTREDMVLWKVPLDLRRALPNASVDAVQQTWGFQDAAQINPRALRAVLADFQNGDLSNIRRAFNYTTLFQPKKPVTRAEAAAALWYFGYQGDGLSAKDALQAEQKAENQPSSSPSVGNQSPSSSQ